MLQLIKEFIEELTIALKNYNFQLKEQSSIEKSQIEFKTKNPIPSLKIMKIKEKTYTIDNVASYYEPFEGVRNFKAYITSLLKGNKGKVEPLLKGAWPNNLSFVDDKYNKFIVNQKNFEVNSTGLIIMLDYLDRHFANTLKRVK